MNWLTEELRYTFGAIQLVLAVIIPFLVYYANLRLFGGRVRFRFLSLLCVAMTGLVQALFTINNFLPLHELTLEVHGAVEDSDPYVLGAMLGGLQLGVLGTLPTAVLHLVRKRRTWKEAGASPAPVRT